MNGFRNSVVMAVICIAVGIFLAKGPVACRPPDMGKCEWNADNGNYKCPEENK
jgi:hypothetical protein